MTVDGGHMSGTGAASHRLVEHNIKASDCLGDRFKKLYIAAITDAGN